MGSYLDKLSAQVSDDDPDALSKEHLLELNRLLFGNQTFVIMTMNWRNTGVLDLSMARTCILDLFNANSSGFATIQDCCEVFAYALDDFAAVQSTLAPVLQDLCSKYSNC